MQVTVRDLQVTTGIIALPDQRNIIAFRLKMPVDAVVTDVQRAIVEPANMQIVLRVGDILDLRKWLDPSLVASGTG
jgi:hypothetical protein